MKKLENLYDSLAVALIFIAKVIVAHPKWKIIP